ncbi:hypothetical protein [Humibacter ginsengisoli]
MTAPTATSVPKAVRREAAERLRALFTSERSRWAVVVLVAWVEVGALFSGSIERDTFWETRAGLENLVGIPIARADTWSWSATGIWYPNSPAWNILLALGWNSSGWWGLAIVAILTCGTLITVLLVVARHAGARALPTLVVVAPLALVGSSSLSGRATVAVMVLLGASSLFAGWWSGRARRQRARTAAVGAGAAGFALSLIGNWVHLSFMPVSALVALSWTVAWCFAPGLPRRTRLGMAAAAAGGLFLGCVCSPYGIALTVARSEAVAAACQGIITEWWSLPVAMAKGSPALVVVMLIGLTVSVLSCVTLVMRIRRRGAVLPGDVALIALSVMSVPFSLAGLTAARFVFPGLFLALPALAVASTDVVGRLRRRIVREHPEPSSRLRIYTTGRAFSHALVAAMIVMIPLAATSVATSVVPVEVMLARQLPAGCQLFSEPGTAGPVLLDRPDVKVWIDGRADFYGHAHLVQFQRIGAGHAPIPKGTTCIILPTTTDDGAPSPVAAALDRSGVWQHVASAGRLALWLPTR